MYLVTSLFPILTFALTASATAYQLPLGGKCPDFQNTSPHAGAEHELQIPGYLVRDGEYKTRIQIRMQNQSTRCNGTGTTTVTVPLYTHSRRIQSHPNYDQSLKIRASKTPDRLPVHFLRDGTLFNGRLYFNPKEEYCVDSFDNQSLHLRLCLPQAEKSIFFPKCCFLDQVMLPNVTCAPSKTTLPQWKPDMYPDTDILGLPLNYSDYHVRYYVEEMPQSCQVAADTLPSTITNDRYFTVKLDRGKHLKVKLAVSATGSVFPVVFQNYTREWVPVAPVNFCVEPAFDTAGLTPQKTIAVGNKVQAENLETSEMYFCSSEKPNHNRNNNSINSTIAIIAICLLLISWLFLLATVVIYLILLREHYLHGLLVLSYSLNVLGRNTIGVVWVFVMIFPDPDYFGIQNRGWPCVTIALVLHYFQISVYTCMTSLNVDLLLTIRSCQVASVRGRQLCKFMWYMVFAWGTPLFLIGAFVVADITYSDPYTEVPVPNYGDRCYVSIPFQGYYVYMPQWILLGANFLLIVASVFVLFKARQHENKTFSDDGSAQKTGCSSLNLWLLIKVFIIMGGADIIWFATWRLYRSKVHEGSDPIWILVLEGIKDLSPVAFFFLFCCTERIRKKLKKKFKSAQ